MMTLQICLALKRIFVQEPIADKFLEAMVEATKTLKVQISSLAPFAILPPAE
jgi:acyl-CoA reductase-like NAD-dependent aldehyde dehydrogenase